MGRRFQALFDQGFNDSPNEIQLPGVRLVQQLVDVVDDFFPFHTLASESVK